MLKLFGFERLKQALSHRWGNTRHIGNPVVMPQRAIDNSLSHPAAYPFRIVSANGVQYGLQSEIGQLLRLRGLALTQFLLDTPRNVGLAEFACLHQERNPL